MQVRNNMRNIFMLSLLATLFSCNSSEGNSSDTMYLSCQINSSHAIVENDRINDLAQCWDADGIGYDSQVYAIEWCESEVSTYMDNTYTGEHTVTYSVESTVCPIALVEI